MVRIRGFSSACTGSLAAITIGCMAVAAPAFAQDVPEAAETDGWDGSIEFSAASATGNSETLNLGLAAKAKREVGRYLHALKGSFNYAEANEVETQNNLLLSYQLDIQLRDRTYSYGRVQYDQDEFSGFENRVFVGAGLGHYFIEREDMTWKLEGGPGFRYSQVEEPEPPIPDDFEENESEFALYGSSEYEWLIRDGVQFTHSFDTTYTDSNTSFKTIAGLSTKLTETLSSKVSYEVRYETDPPEDREKTDTLLKASVLYDF